jgi:hypothetical protein
MFKNELPLMVEQEHWICSQYPIPDIIVIVLRKYQGNLRWTIYGGYTNDEFSKIDIESKIRFDFPSALIYRILRVQKRNAQNVEKETI